MVVSALAWVLFASGDPSIVNGTAAGACEFPSAVAIIEEDETPVMCSGTLVHPNVVTLAAHCIIPERPIVAVGFGEDGLAPARTIPVDECVPHPNYAGSGFPDIAYCTLTQAVDDVPIVPILAGCEADVLEVGLEVTIVGYGSTYGTVNGMGEVEATGVGPKRWTTQTIDLVEPDYDEVAMVGEDGSDSACFGDSGGPALVELEDGTWRVFGAASRLYDPGGFPPPQEEGNYCGIGVIYGWLSHRLEWFEDETGYDLTPCHEADGSWDPGAGCGDFPTEPHAGHGSWGDGCVGGIVGGGDPLCDDPVDPTTGGDTTWGGETGYDPTATTSPGTSGPLPPPLPPVPPSTSTSTTTITTTSSPPPPTPTDDDVEGTGDDAGQGDGDGLTDRGCTCRGGGGPPAAPLLIFILLGSCVRRPRRPSR